MAGWRLFWALVGYLAFIVVLIFLYFYKPFEAVSYTHLTLPTN